MIKMKQKGDFTKLDKYFKKSVKISKKTNLTSIAERCIEQLREATPKDSGLTADSWKYTIIKRKHSTILLIYNTNIQNGAKVALLLEYGHATTNGTWVEGENYIDPVVREAYNKILNTTWKEMTSL